MPAGAFEGENEIRRVIFEGVLVAIAIGGYSVSAAAQTSPTFQRQLDPNINADITRVLGNRYNQTERTAVMMCSLAATQMASVQFWPKLSGIADDMDPQRNSDGGGINPAARMYVSAITGVQLGKTGAHVSGVIDGRAGYPFYGPAYGAAGDLSFSCDADYNGIVKNVRINATNVHPG